jgi:adenylylsulfate kinase-like enzyme
VEDTFGTRDDGSTPGAPAPPTPGVCVWLTGMSGSGKSTLTRALVPRLYELGRTVSVLDTVPLLAKQPGERTSEGKLLRKGYVAARIADHGGIAVCVTVSARREVREAVRDLVGPDRFVEVHVHVPIEVAADRRAARGRRTPLRRRVRNGARAAVAAVRRRPPVVYEVPTDPDVTVDTTTQTPEEAAEAVLAVLSSRGFLRRSGEAPLPGAYGIAGA